MKIKLDENLPETLAADLRALGHDVDTVLSEELKGHPDSDVWHAAQRAGRFLITQDLDFSDSRAFAPGSHAGVLLVRLARPGRTALRHAVLRAFAENQEWTGSFAVVTERKLRVSRAPKPG